LTTIATYAIIQQYKTTPLRKNKMTKGQNRKADRRRLRSKEKASDLKREKMRGACCRRRYGGGLTR